MISVRNCPDCGQANRIPPAHLANTGRCGACKASLPPTSAPLEIENTKHFDEIVKATRVPVLIDFWAEWCGPCRMAAPEVKKAAQSVAGKALVLKVDTEKNPELARRFDVKGIPYFVVMKGGAIVNTKAGLMRQAELEQRLEQARNT